MFILTSPSFSSIPLLLKSFCLSLSLLFTSKFFIITSKTKQILFIFAPFGIPKHSKWRHIFDIFSNTFELRTNVNSLITILTIVKKMKQKDVKSCKRYLLNLMCLAQKLNVAYLCKILLKRQTQNHIINTPGKMTSLYHH